MQEDLWLTDKRRGDVTERSSSGSSLICSGAGNEERKCSWVLFPTVGKATVGMFRETFQSHTLCLRPRSHPCGNL